MAVVEAVAGHALVEEGRDLEAVGAAFGHLRGHGVSAQCGPKVSLGRAQCLALRKDGLSGDPRWWGNASTALIGVASKTGAASTSLPPLEEETFFLAGTAIHGRTIPLIPPTTPLMIRMPITPIRLWITAPLRRL